LWQCSSLGEAQIHTHTADRKLVNAHRHENYLLLQC